MKKMLLLTVVLVLVAGIASAGIVDSKHDMRTWITGGTVTTQVCVFCHTPHGANGVKIDPLWNHSMSAVTSYGNYTSDTMNATTSDLGAGTTTSHLCLSCHDGTVGVNQLIKPPTDGVTTGTYGSALNGTAQITSGANLGTSLSNDHPINFSYDSAISNGDTGLNSTVSGSIVFFGATRMLQCASCHAVHDPTNEPFLRLSNANSGLCLACHAK